MPNLKISADDSHRKVYQGLFQRKELLTLFLSYNISLINQGYNSIT